MAQSAESTLSPGVRVVFCGTAETKWQELPFEIFHCENALLLADYCRDTRAVALVVDLDLFLDSAPFHKLPTNTASLRVLAIGDVLDDATSERVLRAGLVGLLPRQASAETLARAINAVLAGELWFPRETVSRVLKAFLAGKDPHQLTAREMEILALIGTGLSNQEIADKLFISRETVRWHVRGLYAKLGIEDRRGAKEYLITLRDRRGMPVRSEASHRAKTSQAAS